MNRAGHTLRRAFLLVLLASGVAAVSAEDILPQAPPADRYLRMADRSPFAPPTLAPPPGPAPTLPPPGPKWSDDLTVALLTQEGGVYFATIQDKSKNERFLLQSDREDKARQLSLASVQWGELVNQTTVTLRHNSEFAAVRFDPNSAIAAPAVGNPVYQPNRLPPPPGGFPQTASGHPPTSANQPPPNPGVVQRRKTVIQSTPTVTAPPHPVPQRRPLSAQDGNGGG